MSFVTQRDPYTTASVMTDTQSPPSNGFLRWGVTMTRITTSEFVVCPEFLNRKFMESGVVPVVT